MIRRYRLQDLKGDSGLRFIVGPAHLNHQDFGYHTHDFSEIAVIQSGSCTHRVMGEAHTVRAGDVYVFNGDAAHAFLDTRDLRVFNIMYDPEVYLRPHRDLKNLPGFHYLFLLKPSARSKGAFKGHLRLAHRELLFINSKLQVLLAEYQGRRPGRQAMLASLFKELVVHLSRLYDTRRHASGDDNLHRVAKVVAHMESHCREPLRLEQLASMAHLSVNQFLRVFREACQTSPTEYLIQRRVFHACEMLRQPGHKMTAVAEACGFTDSNYLARQFRRVMGMSPSAWQAQLPGREARRS